VSWSVDVGDGARPLAQVGGPGGCRSSGLVGGNEGLLAEGSRWLRWCGTCWGLAIVDVGCRVWLGAEAVKGGLVAGD
jgi:hypothetical protein